MTTLIINYHFIKDDERPALAGLMGITQEAFQRQLRELNRHFDMISLAEYCELIDAQSSSGKYCIITFDDGMIDGYRYARPVLTDQSVKAAFFICSATFVSNKVLDVHKINLIIDRIGSERLLEWLVKQLESRCGDLKLDDPERLGITNIYPYDSGPKRELKLLLNYRIPIEIKKWLVDEKFREIGFDEAEMNRQMYMKEDELRALAASGHEIGMHTTTHEMLARMSEGEQELELNENYARIEHTFGKAPSAVSYPYGMAGTYNSRTLQAVAGLGLTFGLTMRRGANVGFPELLELKRYSCADVFTRDGEPTDALKKIIMEPEEADVR